MKRVLIRNVTDLVVVMMKRDSTLKAVTKTVTDFRQFATLLRKDFTKLQEVSKFAIMKFVVIGKPTGGSALFTIST